MAAQQQAEAAAAEAAHKQALLDSVTRELPVIKRQMAQVLLAKGRHPVEDAGVQTDESGLGEGPLAAAGAAATFEGGGRRGPGTQGAQGQQQQGQQHEEQLQQQQQEELEAARGEAEELRARQDELVGVVAELQRQLADREATVAADEFMLSMQAQQVQQAQQAQQAAALQPPLAPGGRWARFGCGACAVGAAMRWGSRKGAGCGGVELHEG